MPKPDNLIDLATFKAQLAEQNQARGHTPAQNPYARKLHRQPVVSTVPKVPQLLIGIDPGEHTGWAEFDHLDEQPELQLQTLDFWGAVAQLERRALTDRHRVHVYLEDPNANPPTFDRGVPNAKMQEKISQNVGSNKRDARLLLSKCQNLGLRVTLITPGDSLTKQDAKAFARLTGYTKRCSEHARDAGLLIYGR